MSHFLRRLISVLAVVGVVCGFVPLATAHDPITDETMNNIGNCSSGTPGYNCQNLAQSGSDLALLGNTSGLSTWAFNDGGTAVISVGTGFPILFGGNTYTTAYISPNGFVSFNNEPGIEPPMYNDYPALPNGTGAGNRPNNGVAIHGTDLQHNGTLWQGDNDGVIRYGTRGSTPNRQFIVWFHSGKHFANSDHCGPTENYRINSMAVWEENNPGYFRLILDNASTDCPTPIVLSGEEAETIG